MPTTLRATLSPSRLVVALIVAVLAVGLPPLLPVGEGGFEVVDRLVPLAFAEGEDDGEFVSDSVKGRVSVAGLTWEDGEAPDEAWVRSHGSEGWSRWSPIEIEDEHGPDPRAPEGTGPEHASAPVIVEGADELQFKVTADRAPQDMKASVVEVDGTLKSQEVRGSAADAALSQPPMVTREQWGGDDCLRDAGKTSDPDYVRDVQVMFVHHTAGRNDYTRWEAPRIVRAICNYHAGTRDWDDIGYNFLIDKFGTIYEGRDGGVAKGVWGAHTGGWNSYSTGVSFMGTHATSAPRSPAQESLRDLAAWKLDLHDVDPLGTTRLMSKGSSKYSYGTWVDMKHISGHRDASSTSCPGTACYNLLPSFRWEIAHQIPGSPWFMDDDGSTFEGDIEWIAEQGITQGCNPPDNTLYCPGDDVTRAEMAAFLVRGLNLTRTTSRQFTDVPSGHTFAVDINKLATAGITKGCNPPDNTRFCPSEAVSRAEMSAFLVRANNLTRTSSAGWFSDVPRDSTFAWDINKLATADITKGCNPPANDRYCPKGDVTRAEMAAFLHRALKDRD